MNNQERNQEIASTIISQLGGIRRLNAMTGAYNFVAIDNGVSFRIKNRSANYIKIVLTSMDLYDLEIGRISGSKYTVVKSAQGLYNDQLKPIIEKATGMYLSLEKGGNVGNNVLISLFKSEKEYWENDPYSELSYSDFNKADQLAKKQHEKGDVVSLFNISTKQVFTYGVQKLNYEIGGL